MGSNAHDPGTLLTRGGGASNPIAKIRKIREIAGKMRKTAGKLRKYYTLSVFCRRPTRPPRLGHCVSGAARLMDAKHKASDFNIEEEFVSITSLDGVELKKNEALSDISQTWQPSHSERARESTLVEVPSTFAFPGVKAKVCASVQCGAPTEPPPPPGSPPMNAGKPRVRTLGTEGNVYVIATWCLCAPRP